MPRFATIDLGTNTALLFVGDWNGTQLTTIHDQAEFTRLGRGVAKTGALNAEAAANALKVLSQYARIVQECQAVGLAAIGTAALRGASDGPAFRQQAAALLGAPLEIISGDDEARLVALSVQRAFPSDQLRIAFDIGGGSTELVLLQGDTILGRKSYPLGSVQLFERFICHDPPLEQEMLDMRGEALQTLAALPFPLPLLQNSAQLVGVAGTVTTTCAVVKGVEPYESAKIHGAVLSREAIEGSLQQMAALSLAERVKLPGLIPGRADVILGGATIFLAILECLQARVVTVSDHGIRHGLFWDRFVSPMGHESR
jgi:exopolyphosphatase / guanosine-5'-triphosphate,3'-diphosphate pyrophosphatase